MDTLFYVHDPMCSWCWGFAPTFETVLSELPNSVKVNHLLGGLAPDSNDPMPESMQLSLQQTWQRIAEVIPGTEFNFDFWTQNAPRRSTWPSCRAVIAARRQSQDVVKMSFWRTSKVKAFTMNSLMNFDKFNILVCKASPAWFCKRSTEAHFQSSPTICIRTAYLNESTN